MLALKNDGLAKSSGAWHESRAVRRHHEGHRPEHIEGEPAPGAEKQPKGASSGLALASPGRLEPFQRACLATIPENRCDAPTFPSVGLNQAEMAVDVFTGPSSLGRQRKERHPARGAADLVTLERPGRHSHAGAWERSYPAISAMTGHVRDPSPCVRQGLRQVRNAGQEDSIGRIVGIAGENIFRPIPAIQAILHQLFISPDPVRFPCFLQCSR